jgi:glutaredoxin
MITVFSKPNCPQCDQAKALLDARGEPYGVVMLDVGQVRSLEEKYITREELLELIPSARMMPQIMIDGIAIGSLSELKKWLG